MKKIMKKVRGLVILILAIAMLLDENVYAIQTVDSYLAMSDGEIRMISSSDATTEEIMQFVSKTKTGINNKSDVMYVPSLPNNSKVTWQKEVYFYQYNGVVYEITQVIEKSEEKYVSVRAVKNRASAKASASLIGNMLYSGGSFLLGEAVGDNPIYKLGKFSITLLDVMKKYENNVSSTTEVEDISASYTINTVNHYIFSFVKRRGEVDREYVCEYAGNFIFATTSLVIPAVRVQNGVKRPVNYLGTYDSISYSKYLKPIIKNGLFTYEFDKSPISQKACENFKEYLNKRTLTHEEVFIQDYFTFTAIDGSTIKVKAKPLPYNLYA